MVEEIYDTLQALIFLGLPKPDGVRPHIYDTPINGWYYGEREVIVGTPAITLQAGSIDIKDLSMGAREVEYKITVSLHTGKDDTNITERNVVEMVRLLESVMRQHRVIWVCTKCPFDGGVIVTPEHYTAEHTALLAPYVTAVTNDFIARWEETHAVGSAPALEPAGVALEAFLRLYEDVRQGNPVAGLSTEYKDILLQYQRDLVDPVRLLYEVTTSVPKVSDGGTGQKFLHGAEFTISAKEVQLQTAYGPNNVPTVSWS